MTKGTIKIRKTNSGKMMVDVYFQNKKGKESNQQIQEYYIVPKELHGKECTFERNGHEIVEIIVEGKALEKKEKIVKKPHHEKQFRQGSNGKSNERRQKVQIPKIAETQETADQGEEFFLNPYHFVDVSAPTPKYPFTPNNKFHEKHNSGYIDVELKNVTPLFIPDPKEDEKTDEKAKKEKKDEHKQMEFFKINGKPVIPSTSVKGQFRTIIETLSNSCFPHDYDRNEIFNFMSRRLGVDVKKESEEIRNLQSGILKRYNNKWYFIKLDMVKVLTVVDRFEGSSKNDYEKSIYYAKNKDGVIEKISIKAATGGIKDYISRKSKSRGFEDFRQVEELKAGKFRIKAINGQAIESEKNEYNKTFPYINLKNGYGLFSAFYGIVRKKTEKWGCLYKLKEVSTDITEMKRRLREYNDPDLNNDRYGGKYAVCQMYLKTSYDIDTKTQDQLFFVFGKENLPGYINEELEKGRGRELEDVHIQRLKSVIAQRCENLKQRNEKDYLLKIQPTSKDVRDRMLVYYSDTDDAYLTYTQVARKPYRYGFAEILAKKAVCKEESKLCPACNMFGGVNIKPKSGSDGDNTISIGGKVSFSSAECLSDNGYDKETLKPLGEPKPSFYQFYIQDNRKDESGESKGATVTYDSMDIKPGRKVYLKHNPEQLDYWADEQTKLNSTVQLLKSGATFRFRIDYFNLSHYELGLLLYSLNLKYKGKRLDIQMGMGKPLGLGRMEITGIDVTQIDRKQRYSSLMNNGESLMSQSEMEKYINIYQRCQVDLGKNVPKDDIELNNKTIADYQVKEPYGFKDLVYIKEFLLLMSINDGIPLKFPIKYPTKKEKPKNGKEEMKGFKWFMDEKDYVNQRLFEPLMLEKLNEENIEQRIPLYNWGRVSNKKENRK